jgi:hypothetical protein
VVERYFLPVTRPLLESLLFVSLCKARRKSWAALATASGVPSLLFSRRFASFSLSLCFSLPCACTRLPLALPDEMCSPRQLMVGAPCVCFSYSFLCACSCRALYHPSNAAAPPRLPPPLMVLPPRLKGQEGLIPLAHCCAEEGELPGLMHVHLRCSPRLA